MSFGGVRDFDGTRIERVGRIDTDLHWYHSPGKFYFAYGFRKCFPQISQMKYTQISQIDTIVTGTLPAPGDSIKLPVSPSSRLLCLSRLLSRRSRR